MLNPDPKGLARVWSWRALGDGISVAVLPSKAMTRSASPYIITHNIAEFRGSEKLGIRAVAPRDFLAMLKNEP